MGFGDIGDASSRNEQEVQAFVSVAARAIEGLPRFPHQPIYLSEER